VALKLQGNMVGPALGAFGKAVIERGHGSWGIYTKSGLGRRDAAHTDVLDGTAPGNLATAFWRIEIAQRGQ
jgi:hypothetical protein